MLTGIGVLMSKKNQISSSNFRGYARVEEDYAVRLEGDVRGYGNEIVREIVNSIAIDSRKHAGLFKACADIAEGKSLSLREDEYDELQSSLRKHEAVELNMIKTVDGLLEQTKDERIRMMLLHIKDDEIRHHALIKGFMSMVVKAEVLLEKEVWDQLFKDVLTHGHAPPDIWEEPER
jgi:hypothetical protein